MTTIMSVNDVLMDLLADNNRRLRRAMDQMSDACLYWSPDAESNSIAVTVWHMGRLFDVFLTQHVKGAPAANECWFSQGWSQRTGYDPRGIGRDGWGSVNGYTPDEVAAIPRFTREQLLAYLADVKDAVNAYLSRTPTDELQTKAVGFDGQYTRYQCIQMALLDNVRHLGEVFTLKAMWERLTARQGGAPPSCARQ